MNRQTLTGVIKARQNLNGHVSIGTVKTETDDVIYVLVDEEGNEYPAVVMDEEITLTASADDIRVGKTAITKDGVTVGTLVCEGGNE